MHTHSKHCSVQAIHIKKFNEISKRNLPNVGMGGWMEAGWLTKYTNKESTFHNIATFHTTIPT